jgi:hypothetical protein
MGFPRVSGETKVQLFDKFHPHELLDPWNHHTPRVSSFSAFSKQLSIYPPWKYPLHTRTSGVQQSAATTSQAPLQRAGSIKQTRRCWRLSCLPLVPRVEGRLQGPPRGGTSQGRLSDGGPWGLASQERWFEYINMLYTSNNALGTVASNQINFMDDYSK